MAKKTKTIPPRQKAELVIPTRVEASTLQAFYGFVEEHGRAPTQRELSEVMGKSTSAAQVPLERLEAKGFVEATIVEARGPLRVTERGKAWLAMLAATLNEAKPKRKRAS